MKTAIYCIIRLAKRKLAAPASVLAIIACLAASLSAKKPYIAPSYAWTMLEPLCLRQPATIDTSYVNYSLLSVPSGVSAAYATTGNLGAPGRNMLYFERPEMSDFFFRDAIAHWIPVQGDHKFYNTRIPMTLMSYNTGGSRDNSQDRLTAIFSGNVNEKLQIGAELDYPYSKGSYANQAAKGMTWGFNGSYISDRFDVQTFFNHYNNLNKENGGITDDLYITDPAELQGGNATINPKNIPTRLTNAHSRVRGMEYLLNASYKVGFWKDDPDADPNDSIQHRLFVPVSSFIWTLDYVNSRHIFDETGSREMADFWSNAYLSRDHTHDVTAYHSLRNTFGISLLEGFNKYAKAGLSVFATHEYRKYTQNPDSIATFGADRPADLTPYPLQGAIPATYSENILWVGAQLTKQQGAWVRYEATGRLGVMGRYAGDIDINGNASLRIPLMRDTLAVTAYGHLSNREAPYLLEKYTSNHFIWSNSFGKTRRVRLGGKLDFAKTDTHLDIGVENIQNALYFNQEALPTQDGGSTQIFSATLRQNLRVGILNWQNRVTYQTSSNEAVIPMPKLAIYSNLFILFKVARVLSVQLGVDCDYYTRYYAPDYQPATMTFYNQRQMKIGNYPFMNAYANFRLSKATFYVMMSHVNQGLFGNDYFSMPHYPLNPRRFQLGLSVDFTN